MTPLFQEGLFQAPQPANGGIYSPQDDKDDTLPNYETAKKKEDGVFDFETDKPDVPQIKIF